jgi:hypothetical protein
MTIQEGEERATSSPRGRRFGLPVAGLALAGVALFALVTYGLTQAGRLFSSPAGFRDGDCSPGPLTESARNGEYVFQTSGVIDLQNELLVVSRRGARLGDRVDASLDQLDGPGRIGLSSPAESREAASDEVVFRVPVYKPAGEGCWKVDVSDKRGTASYVVQVQNPPTAVSFSPLPSLPGVTYVGWVRVESVRSATLRVTPTMGSPSQLFVGRTVDLIFDGQVAATRNDCLLVEFVADAESDGRHKVVSIRSGQAPDPVRCTS